MHDPEPRSFSPPSTDTTPPASAAEAVRPKRPYRLSPEGRASDKALAARRANLELARAAPRDRIYRRTRRRREASRRNIQRALAWRRSPQGNARARLNAFQHGLAAKTSPELRAALGEAPEDFGRHLDLVARVFLPRDREEGRLVERLAQASWNHMRVFRAQARMERFAWRRLGARPGRLTLEEFSERAYEVSKLFALAHLVDSAAGKYEDQIERLLAALLRGRAKREGVGGEQDSGFRSQESEEKEQAGVGRRGAA